MAVDPGVHWDAGIAAVEEIAALLHQEGVNVARTTLLDLSADGGVAAYGLAQRVVAEVAAFHPKGYDVDVLNRLAGRAELPSGLTYSRRNAIEIPQPTHHFDAALMWTGLQTASTPVSLIAEIRRVLKPQCPLLLRLDPLWCATAGDPRDPWRADGFTLDELQRSMLAARFLITRVIVPSSDVRVPTTLLRYPLSTLAVQAVTLVAIAEAGP